MRQLPISKTVFIAETVKKGVFLMLELFRMLSWNSILKNVSAAGFVLQPVRLRQYQWKKDSPIVRGPAKRSSEFASF
jgi:hypothetical protein